MSGREVVVAVVADDRSRAAAYAIRHEVFVDEQHVPVELELDAADPGAVHVLVVVNGEPVATGRLVAEPAGYKEGVDPAAGAVAHLGRVAVLARHRGAGLGALLVRALESEAADAGLAVAFLGAQTSAVPFYEKLGYAAYGAVFDDAGIPHRRMTRLLG